ncbi:MAG: YdjY domain-containing protein [Planctomycetota bacterium]
MMYPALAAALTLAACHAIAQQPASRPAQDAMSQKAALEKLLAKGGIRVDWKKRAIYAKGRITVTRDFIEYIAIGPRGKKHEAMLTLDGLGSTLNAALLALGLKPGKNVDYKPVVPPPTEKEAMDGAPTTILIEPEGPEVHLAVSWTDDKGKEKRYAIEDLLYDLRADAPARDVKWIYIGGQKRAIYRGEPPVFVADYDQNYISNYYVKPDNHLITIKHARARDDENWWPVTDRLPERGTPCELILSLEPVVKLLPLPKKDKEKKDKEQRKEPGKELGKDGKSEKR